MYDSAIGADILIESIKSEADIAPDIPDRLYLYWLSAAEQLIYTEIIKEKSQFIIENPTSGAKEYVVDLENLTLESSDEEKIRYDEVYAVYVNTTQLIRSEYASGSIFANVYFRYGKKLKIKYEKSLENATLKIIYIVKPKIKEMVTTSGSNVETLPATTVKIPFEFIDMIKAKLRGEAYKLANEDTLAAKWLNDYNVQLENFKAWVERQKLGV